MIRQLRAVLGPEDQGDYTKFLIWVSIYGILQGLAVTLLIPISRTLVEGDYAATWRWLALMTVAVIACAFAHYRQAMCGFTVALAVLRTMHLNIGDHLVTLPLGWFSGRTASISQIAAKGTLSVGGAAAHLMTPVAVGIASPATVAVIMLFLDWRIGIALFCCAPIIWASSRLTAYFIARSEATTHAAEVESSERVMEFARCQGALRAAGRTGTTTYQPLEDAIENQQQAGRRSLLDATLGLLLNTAVVQFVFSAIIIVTALLAKNGELTGIELLALLGVATRFVQPVTEIAEFGGPIRMARNQLSRIEEIMLTQAMPAPEQSAELARRSEIEFDHVDFGYAEGTPVLRDITFTAEPHQVTAIVGPSGSGKTTITRLIARFYDVDSGVVRVGGADVRDQTTEDLMAQLSLVFQDVYLFDDTLRENIRLGRPEASEEAIDEAAYLAGVTEIAERLPQGWDTRVGEAGSALSGGERQRVSIARAILKNAPIVLLDEATAALDPENERFVGRSLVKLRDNASLIVIAHKLTTVEGADQILVLDEHGGITERGRHEDLLARGGRYADFWAERSRAAGWRLNA